MGGLRDRVCERKRKDLVQKQGEERWCKPLWFLHDEQEVDYGGGVQQSHVEVPAGNSELFIFSIKYNLTFQAGLINIEGRFMHFEQPESKPEALGLKYFYFPLGLSVVGILLSLLSLLAEIILHRMRKSKTDVSMVTLVEPRVTQSDIEDTKNTP